MSKILQFGVTSSSSILWADSFVVHLVKQHVLLSIWGIFELPPPSPSVNIDHIITLIVLNKNVEIHLGKNRMKKLMFFP